MEPNPPGERSGRPSAPTPPASRQRLGLREVMALVVGLAVGMWLMSPDFRAVPRDRETPLFLIGAAGLLGGLAIVGVPILLAERRRSRILWGPGKLLWFASGTAAWLLWPPVVFRRVKGAAFTD